MLFKEARAPLLSERALTGSRGWCMCPSAALTGYYRRSASWALRVHYVISPQFPKEMCVDSGVKRR